MPTDLDLTKACAEAMGFYWAAKPDEYPYIGMHKYDPLHDDAQAMALVKKFQIEIEFDTSGNWHTMIGLTGGWNTDLNRAIVEAVAKLHDAKT